MIIIWSVVQSNSKLIRTTEGKIIFILSMNIYMILQCI